MTDFMNPKSMSTPGAAGALMMLLANSLCTSFPEFAFRYVALALSFAIGAVVFAAAAMKLWERGVYWVVNSLIIFAMGVGASNIGANIEERRSSARQAPIASEVLSFFTGTAFAQSNPAPAVPRPEPRSPAAGAPGTSPPKAVTDPAAAARVKALEARVRELEAARRTSELEARRIAERNRFFRRW